MQDDIKYNYDDDEIENADFSPVAQSDDSYQYDFEEQDDEPVYHNINYEAIAGRVSGMGFFRTTLIVLLVIMLLPVVGGGFLTYIVVRQLFRMVVGVGVGIGNAIAYIFYTIVDRIVSLAIAAIVIGGGIYIFWIINPNLENQVDRKLDQLSALIDKHIGLSLPNMPEFSDITNVIGDFFGEKISSELNDVSSNLKDIPSSLMKAIGANDISLDSIPSELKPLLSLKLDPKDMEKYISLIKTGDIGDKAEKAIPLLSKSLMSYDDDLRTTSYNILKTMNTPKSRRALSDYTKEYEKLIKEAAKNANTRN